MGTTKEQWLKSYDEANVASPHTMRKLLWYTVGSGKTLDEGQTATFSKAEAFRSAMVGHYPNMSANIDVTTHLPASY
jgi:hypothetical protein